jgi:hypothetical protein
MECRYCGNAERVEPIDVCICGRSGSWEGRYSVNLIPCSEAEMNDNAFLKWLRRLH